MVGFVAFLCVTAGVIWAINALLKALRDFDD
jgi:hypothetical protein